jgi:flagellar hook-basal body complex protein FliE
MTILPVDPALAAGLGPEWQIPGIAAPADAAATPGAPEALGVDGVAPASGPGGGFGNVLAQQVGNLTDLQETAAAASQSLADGTATDVASVVTAVEKAQLAMQLAGQIRTRGSEAVNDIFHTQI